jgi:hypothetical protein
MGASVHFAAMVSKTGVPEGANGTTSFTLDADLQPTTKFYWRARMSQGNTVSEWSPVGHFKSRLVGYIRAGELYDPLIHGESVGELVGPVEFVPGRGAKLTAVTAYVRYHLPQTISDGEFSMDVEGLQGNAPGNKAKVFGMQDGQGDFITNRYRVDAQYRGSSGSPPNAIQWRAMFGSNDDKIEPPTAKRYESVFLLDPTHDYYWKATWSNGFRLTVLDGGQNGSPLYDYGIEAHVAYTPKDHYAYLGHAGGRSGIESASIAGTIYPQRVARQSPAAAHARVGVRGRGRGRRATGDGLSVRSASSIHASILCQTSARSAPPCALRARRIRRFGPPARIVDAPRVIGRVSTSLVPWSSSVGAVIWRAASCGLTSSTRSARPARKLKAERSSAL